MNHSRLDIGTMAAEIPAIKTFKQINPTLYAYTMPGVEYNEG